MKRKAKHQSSYNIRPLVAAKGGSQFTRFSKYFDHTKTSSSFAIAHWDAQKAARPLCKRYIFLIDREEF